MNHPPIHSYTEVIDYVHLKPDKSAVAQHAAVENYKAFLK